MARSGHSGYELICYVFLALSGATGLLRRGLVCLACDARPHSRWMVGARPPAVFVRPAGAGTRGRLADERLFRRWLRSLCVPECYRSGSEGGNCSRVSFPDPFARRLLSSVLPCAGRLPRRLSGYAATPGLSRILLANDYCYRPTFMPFPSSNWSFCSDRIMLPGGSTQSYRCR